MLGPLLAFVTLGTWSLSDLIIKHALNKQSLWFISFWSQTLGGFSLLILGFALGEIQGVSLASLPWIVLFSVINILGMFLFYKAIQAKGVALSLPIIYSWSLFTILLGMIFLSEVPSLIQGIGIAVVLLGIFCVGIDPQAKRWVDRGTFIAFLGMLCFGLFYFWISDPSEVYGQWWLGGCLKIGSGLLSLPFLLHERQKEVSPKQSLFWTMGFIGLLDALGLVALTTGLQVSSVAVVTGITSTAPVVVALCGIFLFKESVNRRQALGIGLTGLGLVLLVL